MKKAVIIGAGPAGLTAAYELLSQSKDYEVVVLEGSDAIGGISKTVEHLGNRMDIGGHRFFSKDERVMRWWSRMMPLQGARAYDDIRTGREPKLAEGGPDPETADRVMLVRRRVSRIYYNGKFFDYPISMKWSTIKNMGLFTTMRAGFSYIKASIFKLPDDSLENFYINRFGKVLYSMFFEDYTEKVWGRHPRAISAEWGAQRVKGLSIRAIIKDIFSKIFTRGEREVETSLIEEFWYPKHGPGQLWETAASEIEKLGGRIEMNARAVALALGGDGSIESVTYERGGERFTEKCDVVFSSMPIKDLVAALPDADENEHAIASGLPYRDFVTVGLLVSKLAIKNETDLKTLSNIVPDCWIYVQDRGVRMGRVQIFNNWSPYMVAQPEETVWLGLEYFCNEGDDFWSMSAEEHIALAQRELAEIGIIPSGERVLDSHRERVQKAYPAYFDTYDRLCEVTEYLDRHPNLFCIGRNGQHRYNNMDHSMATAFEAVSAVISGNADRANVWNVNTEKAYHESGEKMKNEG